MPDKDTALQRANDLVERAMRLGAESCDVAFSASESQGVQIRLGALEDVERSESEHISLRLFVGSRSSSIGSTDFSDQALDDLAQRALDMARVAPEDPYAGLAPQERIATGPFPDLDLVSSDAPDSAALRAQALEAEDAARAVKGVTNSQGGDASTGRSLFALATSHGFSGAYEATSRSISASVIAGEGDSMQRDYAWRQARHGEELLSPKEIGQLAGTRAVARLNPAKVSSAPMPVVFDPRVASSLISHLIGAMSGPGIARKASFLLGKRDAQLFAETIAIVEEPHRQRGLRSRPFDGEGLATVPRRLIDQGRITGWLMNSASARQLGEDLTGHASRGGGGAPGVSVSNVHLEPGDLSPVQLMSDIADGVYVTELIGQGVNGVTGDYSRGASGFRIVNGEIAGPVSEFTVAGNLIDMFAKLTPADDIEWHRAINVPTVRVDGMTVAGD